MLRFELIKGYNQEAVGLRELRGIKKLDNGVQENIECASRQPTSSLKIVAQTSWDPAQRLGTDYDHTVLHIRTLLTPRH